MADNWILYWSGNCEGKKKVWIWKDWKRINAIWYVTELGWGKSPGWFFGFWAVHSDWWRQMFSCVGKIRKRRGVRALLRGGEILCAYETLRWRGPKIAGARGRSDWQCTFVQHHCFSTVTGARLIINKSLRVENDQ